MQRDFVWHKSLILSSRTFPTMRSTIEGLPLESLAFNALLSNWSCLEGQEQCLSLLEDVAWLPRGKQKDFASHSWQKLLLQSYLTPSHLTFIISALGDAEGHSIPLDTTVQGQNVSSVVTVDSSSVQTSLSFTLIVFRSQNTFSRMLPTSIPGGGISSCMAVLLMKSCLPGKMSRLCLMGVQERGQWQHPWLPSRNNSNKKGNRLSNNNSSNSNNRELEKVLKIRCLIEWEVHLLLLLPLHQNDADCLVDLLHQLLLLKPLLPILLSWLLQDSFQEINLLLQLLHLTSSLVIITLFQGIIILLFLPLLLHIHFHSYRSLHTGLLSRDWLLLLLDLVFPQITLSINLILFSIRCILWVSLYLKDWDFLLLQDQDKRLHLHLHHLLESFIPMSGKLLQSLWEHNHLSFPTITCSYQSTGQDLLHPWNL